MAARFHRDRLPPRRADMMALGEDPASARCRPRCQNKPRLFRPRPLHQSTLSLGDTAPCYTSTHAQSYCGRSADGRPLAFRLRDPSFPSQHRSRLELRDAAAPPQLQSHSRQVHGPQRITPKVDPKLENWTQYRSGRAVRELINPLRPSEYRTTYRAELTAPEPNGPAPPPSGRRLQWHQHDVLTGEQKQPANQGTSSRRCRDELLWAARRWETDCTALRLY